MTPEDLAEGPYEGQVEIVPTPEEPQSIDVGPVDPPPVQPESGDANDVERAEPVESNRDETPGESDR